MAAVLILGYKRFLSVILQNHLFPGGKMLSLGTSHDQPKTIISNKNLQTCVSSEGTLRTATLDGNNR